MKRLILIDGNAILHRAYHALPPLTAPDGTLVNAVYGFFSMFLTVLHTQKPDYVVICFDRPKPTFRQELFVGYQQHRPKMSDDLVPQIQLVHDVLGKMRVAIFEVDGYEADDLIGTISVKAVAENMEVIIVSGDRDLLQLVNNRVKMLAPVVGVKNIVLYDEEAVVEKFGVKPSQFVDYKALIGDSSDGYPGVSGIGPKTASQLLRQFGSFEGLYKNLQDVSPKIAEKLAQDAEQAALAKKLAGIVTDAPIDFTPEKCAVMDFDTKGATEAFRDLGFESLIKRLTNGNGQAINSSKEKAVKKTDEQLGLL